MSKQKKVASPADIEIALETYNSNDRVVSKAIRALDAMDWKIGRISTALSAARATLNEDPVRYQWVYNVLHQTLKS